MPTGNISNNNYNNMKGENQMYKNAEIAAYITAMINHNDRVLMGQKSPTMLTPTYKRYAEELSDLLDFATDKTVTDSKSTLELNKDLTESARAYKTSLETISQQECTITTLSMDVYNFGYIEKENKMLESENLRLKSQLAMASVSGREIRELKALNEVYKSVIDEQQCKIKKLTGPYWVD